LTIEIEPAASAFICVHPRFHPQGVSQLGKPTGFMEYERIPLPARPADVRLSDFYEIYAPADEHMLRQQGARCMDCGIPFCQSDPGCPIDNQIGRASCRERV
jgi:hypothetical protein